MLLRDMNEKKAEKLRARFGLRHSQFFAHYAYKNLWWELDGDIFGYGDLKSEDIFAIQKALNKGEVFQGWNEHHGTDWQQTDLPMIRIKSDDIQMRSDILEEAEERKR